jgi:Pyruvate/2-oxoacid:ferredoxin oxidoreductase delta subunit
MRSQLRFSNNNLYFNSLTNRGVAGWGLAVLLTGFYVVLYWYPRYLEGGIRLVDPLAYALAGQPADQWFLYGFLYTLAVLIFGVRMLLKYRGNRYQIFRTYSVMFFQLGLAFLLPHVLRSLNEPEFYFSYFWPLKYDYLFPGTVRDLIDGPGRLGVFMVSWGAVMTFVATPVLTYFFGKRWYCSWVCGCGGLAETMGDPFRQLSDKSTRAWKIERWMIHLVLVLVVVTTALLWINNNSGGTVLGPAAYGFKQWYGFMIGMVFAGVVGVGFYPLMGSRVWCRFGCPMAAVLGVIQRFFSRFRITVNGRQCMSCGNCSTYCEMGIDVRSYAQRGENIVRASCVGCGVCAAVCPRGVLKLENGRSHRDRYPGADRPAAAFLESLGLKRRTRGGRAYWS